MIMSINHLNKINISTNQENCTHQGNRTSQKDRTNQEDHFKRALKDIFILLVQAEERLKEEEDIDLSPLNNYLQTIAESITSQPLSATIKEDLETLQTSLTYLSQKIEAKEKAIRQDIQQLNHHARGITRYLQTMT
jgi:uncharacterized membrane protein YccC